MTGHTQLALDVGDVEGAISVYAGMFGASPAKNYDAAPMTNGSLRTPGSSESGASPVGLTLLGGFQVRVGDGVVAARHWSRRQSAALVKLLAMSPGRSLHRELVMDALWPGLGVDDAAPRLHKAAHYARRSLGDADAVVLRADAVSLWPDAEVHVDMVQFRHLAESALSNGSVAAAKGALAFYGGELLPQDLYESWAEPQRLHVRRLYVELLRLAEDWHQVLAAEPADEPAHLALVGRYAARGDRVAALRQLDRLDRVMRRELGLGPSERARELRRQILQAASHRNSREDVDAVDDDAPCFPEATLPPPCCSRPLRAVATGDDAPAAVTY
jgi:DNA-binding SARP family transcriptional activator